MIWLISHNWYVGERNGATEKNICVSSSVGIQNNYSWLWVSQKMRHRENHEWRLVTAWKCAIRMRVSRSCNKFCFMVVICIIFEFKSLSSKTEPLIDTKKDPQTSILIKVSKSSLANSREWIFLPVLQKKKMKQESGCFVIFYVKKQSRILCAMVGEARKMKYWMKRVLNNVMRNDPRDNLQSKLFLFKQNWNVSRSFKSNCSPF